MRSLRELGEAAYHVLDVGLKQAPDAEVLRYAGQQGWSLISADRKILRRPHERAAIGEAGVAVFFLNDTLAGLCDISRAIYRHWPDMKRLGRSEQGPAIYLVGESSVRALRRRHLR